VGAQGSDSSLVKELAAGGVQDDFAGGGCSETAREPAVDVGDDLGGVTQKFGGWG